MRAGNETCVQKVRFSFALFGKSGWKERESPWQRLSRNKGVSPVVLRASKDFLTWRLERIATMMELLLAAHGEWGLASRKDQVVMETETLDFNQALQVLRQHGFRDDEFVLTVEYSRKWGVL
ncbi:MAG: hypothetical protein QMC95_07840 [Desulfitobacteriaceae bacterium]|nr:hypothetical protein [Desulfitobacteriaceae bacterium]MDI6878698.1 hypothetical protein [Desulfitobacteriaceae bacterium]MDI6914119.1 hypothetical protein [Desulfitobacteriaceae bacterium]